MKLRALVLSGCVSLIGCQAPLVLEQAATQSAIGVSNVSMLNVATTKIPGQVQFNITERSQVLSSSDIDSPVAAIELPTDRGALAITVTSLIDDHLFAPYVKIMRKDGSVIDDYDFNEFTYLKPRFVLGNRLEAEFNFLPPTNSLQPVILVIYTKREALNQTTDVIHPARLDAEARGNHLPEVKDIPVPHALTGTISVVVDGAASVKPANAQPTRTITPSNKAYYETEIEKAVTNNDLKKAVGLLEEAEALGIEGMRTVFNKAVNL
ncbi:MalM family protein [Vibrio sp. ZSDZ34]|uniref:MalM family protein n=1 Tax=Vibrio gelatinilyticus TaxID=2893468 RepID=A0A9X2AZC5_9VIBR|nr:MalM family protein [Vibrio gelatinilyticus]MCJ2377622.1 MalM family protein [Vibrio gelatinilyticus]